MKLSKLKARTMMRSVGGCTVPRQNSTSVGMRAAMKASGGSCGEVEGGASRPRLDRPSRIKRADGGRVKRADGGWTGEGDTGQKMRDNAAEARTERNKNLLKDLPGSAAAAVVGSAVVDAAGRRFGLAKLTGRAMQGAGGLFGATEAVSGTANHAKAKEADKLADKAEGRKSGGRVSDAAQDKKMIASMIHKHEAHDHKGAKETKFAKGGSLDGLKDMKKGALRKSLHVKEGEKIPEKKLEKAEHSDNPTLRKRAVLARTMRSWKKN